MEIPPPRLPECEHWSLTTQLDHEKEVTGMFLSGHPLDHYRFEMKHYGITSVADFNEFRESIRMQLNPGRTFRLLGLVADAQHRIARSGNKYGNFVIEDYSGKTEFPLFSEDYLKISPFLQQGSTVMISGFLKQRFNKDEYEFKVQQVSLAETLKKTLTKQLNIEAHPQDITKEVVEFVEKNMRGFRGGRTVINFILSEPKAHLRVNLTTGTNTIEMNEELIQFLEKKPEFDVQVLTNS
jgi:DNA polymerase-3 subunit alpha